MKGNLHINRVPALFEIGLKIVNFTICMKTIKKKYIVNERNEKIAVQLDIKTFEKIERAMEDYVLGEKMLENNKADRLSVNEAKEYYKRLKKKY